MTAKRKSVRKVTGKTGARVGADAKASRKTSPGKAAKAKPAAKKYELKTKPTAVSVEAFIEGLENEGRRKDARTLVALMKKLTGARPKMWGPSIIGFGEYHYKYASGHEGDMCVTGFSPRAASLVIYVLPGFQRYESLLSQLGKHKHGKSCLYVNKLADIDMQVLEKLIAESYATARARHKS